MRTIEQLPLRYQGAIENFTIVTTRELPHGSDIRAFRPDIKNFIDPEAAGRRGEPHGLAHIARLLIIGFHFIDKQASSHNMLALPFRSMMEALAIHDCRVSNYENYENHGPNAVAWFEQTLGSLRYGSRWDTIAFLVSHHSDKPGAANGLHSQPLRNRVALEIIQDIDASDLTRPGADIPMGDIILRTEAARVFSLPVIMQALRETADNIDTGDPFEDQIQAALRLGLILPDKTPNEG